MQLDATSGSELLRIEIIIGCIGLQWIAVVCYVLTPGLNYMAAPTIKASGIVGQIGPEVVSWGEAD